MAVGRRAYTGGMAPFSAARILPLLSPTLALLLLTLASLALAQTGGGFGGDFGAPPSGGFGGGGDFGGGGGFDGFGGGGGGPIILGGGAPVVLGGGGGGGLIFLVMFAVVAFVIISSMRSATAAGARGVAGGMGRTGVKAVMVQVLLFEGDEVKKALQHIAAHGDPGSREGLSRMVSEAALATLRAQDRWVYGDIRKVQAGIEAVQNQVGAWGTEARAAFGVQTTARYGAGSGGMATAPAPAGSPPENGSYLAVTIVVGATAVPQLPDGEGVNAAELRAALAAVAGIAPANLIRADVVWSPDQPGEFLTETEAIQRYPSLSRL